MLGNQLFEQWFEAPAGARFVMIESRQLALRYRYHQQKLVLIFASMRRFAERLREAGYEVSYLRFDDPRGQEPYFDRLDQLVKSQGIESIELFEIADRGFRGAFHAWAERSRIHFEFKPSPSFLTSTGDLREQLDRKKPFMKNFYEWQRRRLRILVQRDGEPVGGAWSFDTENRQKLPRGYVPPPIPPVSRPAVVTEVIEAVGAHFSDHPGEAAEFWLPTVREEALEWLRDFLENRLRDFGP